MILTVENQDSGMVCNTDQYLRLRVYLSGRIEGDKVNDKPKTTTANILPGDLVKRFIGFVHANL